MAYQISSFDHTADTGIIVHADSLPELFAGAAVGMFASMYRLDGLVPDRSCEISVTAPDREALLVAWLQELIFRFDVEEEIYTGAAVQQLTDTSRRPAAHPGAQRGVGELLDRGSGVDLLFHVEPEDQLRATPRVAPPGPGGDRDLARAVRHKAIQPVHAGEHADGALAQARQAVGMDDDARVRSVIGNELIW